MKTIRDRIQRSLDNDSGFTLVEVVVAMFIFALISTGAIYTMVQILSVTRDTRAREVAANLAAQEIDLARDTGNLFELLNDEKEFLDLNGDNFYVNVDSEWVSDPDIDESCGAGGGALQYKRINVSVKWGNMRAGAEPVQADTLISPRERINDPILGTILVSALKSDGTGSAGLAVNANAIESPAVNPGASLPTDAQGCSYILKVAPGKYTVSVSKTGYVDVAQSPDSSTVTTTVEAGKASSVGFEFEQAGVIAPRFGSNHSPLPRVAGDMETSFLSPYGPGGNFVMPMTGNRKFSMYPFTSGYGVMAGSFELPRDATEDAPASAGCVSVDPEQWPERADGASGARVPVVAAPAGTESQVDVPMGVIRVSGIDNRYIKAVSASGAGTDDPGCANSMTYIFDRVSTSSTTIALPFGSWTLSSSSSKTGSYSTISSGNINVLTEKGSPTTANVITLDPRTVTP